MQLWNYCSDVYDGELVFMINRLKIAQFFSIAAVSMALATMPASNAMAPSAKGRTTSATAPTALHLEFIRDVAMPSFRARGNITESFSTPAVGDLTGDGVPEIVTAAMDGQVVARRIDGATLWAKNYDGWGVQASPVLTDIDGNGTVDVLLGLMGGKVVWINGQSGNVARTFNYRPTGVCPVGTDPYCKTPGAFGTPVVADITGDGRNDIVATNWDHQLYAWRQDGSLIFRKYLLDTVWSSPIVADVDRDGRREIIVMGTISYGGKKGGYVWVLRADGTNYPGFPKYLPGQAIWSTPAAIDLDGDRDLDLVFGTGGDFSGTSGYKVSAIEARTGRALPGWPVVAPGNVYGSPAVGDITGDGKPEVVFASQGGYVQAHRADGSRIWRVCNAWGSSACGPGYPTHGSATLGDLNGDGSVEVISALDKHLRVFNGRTGVLQNDEVLQGYQQPAVFGVVGSATISSVNGKAWIVQSALVDANRSGKRDRGDIYRTWAWSADGQLGAAPWPTFKHDMQRTGTDAQGTQTWAPFATARAFVRQQYLDFLGREPDPGGLEYWTDLIVRGKASGAKLAEQFLISREFSLVNGPVVRLSIGLTGRPPVSLSTTNGFIDRVRSGTAIATVADEIVAASPAAELSNRAFVVAVYVNTFGQEPTTAQRIAGEQALAGGKSRGTWLAEFLATPFAAAVTQHDVHVAMTYMAMLQRAPDLVGYQYWVRQLDAGISIRKLVSLFQFSREYTARF